MSLIVELFVLVVLGAMAVQDFRIRAIHQYWFFALFAACCALNGPRLLKRDYWEGVLINVELIGLLFALLTAYCSIKLRRFVVITREFMGLADFLLLIAIALYLSVLNFLAFYICSIIIVLIAWTLWLLMSGKRDQTVPLAGLQAILFMFFITGDWFWFHFHATDDFWLWHTFFYN